MDRYYVALDMPGGQFAGVFYSEAEVFEEIRRIVAAAGSDVSDVKFELCDLFPELEMAVKLAHRGRPYEAAHAVKICIGDAFAMSNVLLLTYAAASPSTSQVPVDRRDLS